MARIILATVGSLGDLHPFIAIGKALVAQRHQVLVAVPEDGLAKVRAAGLEAASIFPSYASVCTRLGLSEQDVVAKIQADTNFIVEEILLPTLQSSTAALDALAVGADVIAGSIFAFAADIVAEKRRIPLATIVLQPMTLFSAWQPPAAPRFELLRHSPRTGLGRSWNRAAFALVGTMLRRRYAKRIDAGCLSMGYAAHSALFPRASVVIHYGGVGTTGQALRAGRPQIVVPHFGDQFDNVARMEAAGLGLTIKRHRFGSAGAKDVVGRVLADTGMKDRAGRIARDIAGEDGAADAARRIVGLA